MAKANCLTHLDLLKRRELRQLNIGKFSFFAPTIATLALSEMATEFPK